MTDVTPIYGFPFPEATDAPDGPTQFENLALAVETVVAALTSVVNGKQPSDADLTALAAIASNGFLARTGAGTAAARTLASAGGSLTITNPAGTAGNPDLSVADTGWITAGFTANTGWTLTGGYARYRKIANKFVFLDVSLIRNGGTITAPSTGNIGNSTILSAIPAAAIPDTNTVPVHFKSNSTSGGAHITTSGTVTILDMNPTSTIVNTDSVDIYAAYYTG